MPIGNMIVPAPHIDDQPTVSLCINQSWAGVLIGQIWELRYPEAWGGTLEENRRARDEIKNLIAMLSSFEGCPDMSTIINCCQPIAIIIRINVETGRWERSFDQGETWSPEPSDPMFSVVQQPAPVTDGVSVTKCDAATNFTTHFGDVIAGCSENLGTATTAAQLAAGVAALLLDIFIIVITGGASAPLVLSITGAIFGAIVAAFGMGKEGFDAYWSSDKLDKVLCDAYETIGENGQWTQATWDDWRRLIKVDLPVSAARDMVLTSVNAAGYIGANNMASYGASSLADCTGCLDGCGSDAAYGAIVADSVYFSQGIARGQFISRTEGVVRVRAVQMLPDRYELTINFGSEGCTIDDMTLVSGVRGPTTYYYKAVGGNWVFGLFPSNVCLEQILFIYGGGSSGVIEFDITGIPCA